MLKHILIQYWFVFRGKIVFMGVFLALFLTANSVQSQSTHSALNQPQSSKPVQPAKEILPDRLDEHWRAASPAQMLGARQLSNLPDADIYKEYGVQKVISRVYTNGKIRAAIEVFEMNFISHAYGLFTFNRGRLPRNSREAREGRYVVRVSKSSPDEDWDQSILEAIKPNLIGGVGTLSSLPLHLPDQGKIMESEKYIIGPIALTKLEKISELKNVINFYDGVEVAAADYHNGNGQMNLVVVEYHTPQLASDGYAQFQDYSNALPQNVEDKRILKRIGNFVVVAVNVQDRVAAQSIVDQIKYEKKIYWAGRKLSDIPLEFRPPDPIETEEAIRTAQVLLRSFYWMGAMLLSAILIGLAAGGLLFHWNRYRRRKLGLDSVFSDAGGTVRLNLDD
ncbi:MAG: hypothetical protein AB7U82_18255 [Blastocatellales bacterium]